RRRGLRADLGRAPHEDPGRGRRDLGEVTPVPTSSQDSTVPGGGQAPHGAVTTAAGTPHGVPAGGRRTTAATMDEDMHDDSSAWAAPGPTAVDHQVPGHAQPAAPAVSLRASGASRVADKIFKGVS